MKTVSLKIDEDIFLETEKMRQRINSPRNRYINEALKLYNKVQRRAMLDKMLAKESAMVREESMNVLKEFEDMDYVD